MAEPKPEWLDAGDLIIASIEIATDFGAYASRREN